MCVTKIFVFRTNPPPPIHPPQLSSLIQFSRPNSLILNPPSFDTLNIPPPTPLHYYIHNIQTMHPLMYPSPLPLFPFRYLFHFYIFLFIYLLSIYPSLYSHLLSFYPSLYSHLLSFYPTSYSHLLSIYPSS